jgi:hypothetical protein
LLCKALQSQCFGAASTLLLLLLLLLLLEVM